MKLALNRNYRSELRKSAGHTLQVRRTTAGALARIDIIVEFDTLANALKVGDAPAPVVVVLWNAILLDRSRRNVSLKTSPKTVRQ